MDDLGSLPRLGVTESEPFAILADLHSNIEAAERVAEWLDDRGVEQAVVLGDLVGYGASPQQTLDLVRERGWSALLGNHEDMLLDPSYVERTRSLKSAARKALDWTRDSLSSESMDFIRTLPRAGWIGADSIGVHGSIVDPRHCYAYIYEFSIGLNVDKLRELDAAAGTIVWYGHTHRPGGFELNGEDYDPLGLDAPTSLAPDRLYFVNPGSVGFPRDGDLRAAFAIYHPKTRFVEPVRLEYDVDSAARKIRAAGYAEELGERLLAAR